MYSPLTGSFFVELPNELKKTPKGLLISKTMTINFFLWCHVRHLNLIKKHPERIKKEDEKLANSLNYEEIKIPVSKNDYC